MYFSGSYVLSPFQCKEVDFTISLNLVIVIKAMLSRYMVVRDYISRHNTISEDDKILKKWLIMLITHFSFCLRKGLVKGNSDLPSVNQGVGFHDWRSLFVRLVLK